MLSTSLALSVVLYIVAMDTVRELVSGAKRRLHTSEFNLDLTYITPRVIAMSLPAEGLEKLYRNSSDEVSKYLNQQHPGQYWCYNLSGITYNYEKFENRVQDFPWEDHHAPSLDLLFQACQHMYSWLMEDPRNVVAVHCKAGKGRTGTLICCFLLFSGRFANPTDAMDYYRLRRFSLGGGVTHPSQQRYIHYFHQVLTAHIKSPSLKVLKSVTLTTFPHYSLSGHGHSSRPFMQIYLDGRAVYNSKELHRDKQEKITDDWEEVKTYEMPLPQGMICKGDILITFSHWGVLGVKKICRLTFNTAFVQGNELVFRKKDLDPDVFVNNTHCSDEFRITLTFESDCSCPSTLPVMSRCADCHRKLRTEMQSWAEIARILALGRRHGERNGAIVLFGTQEDDVEVVMSRVGWTYVSPVTLLSCYAIFFLRLSSSCLALRISSLFIIFSF